MCLMVLSAIVTRKAVTLGTLVVNFTIETMCFTCRFIRYARTSSSDVSELSPPINTSCVTVLAIRSLSGGSGCLFGGCCPTGVVVRLVDVVCLGVVVQQGVDIWLVVVVRLGFVIWLGVVVHQGLVVLL